MAATPGWAPHRLKTCAALCWKRFRQMQGNKAVFTVLANAHSPHTQIPRTTLLACMTMESQIGPTWGGIGV